MRKPRLPRRGFFLYTSRAIDYLHIRGVVVHKVCRPILLMLVLQVPAVQTASASLQSAYELLVTCFEQQQGVPDNAFAATMVSCLDRSNWNSYLSHDESIPIPDDQFVLAMYRAAAPIAILSASGVLLMIANYGIMSMTKRLERARLENLLRENALRFTIQECCICNQKGVDFVTECGHYYHYDDLQKWFKEQHNCPMCRAPLNRDGRKRQA